MGDEAAARDITRDRGSRRRAPRRLLAAVGMVAAVTLVARRLGYNLGGNVVVRCRQGHLFTTLWIPGVKFKALDLLVARVQRCPVGRHWTLVVPVRESQLSAADLAFARTHHDVLVP